MNKTPETLIRTRFKDCDPFGHLYNTRFIEYMLEAREDQLREYYGIHLMDYINERKKAWVIIRHEIMYLKELKVNEEALIRTCMIESGDKKIVVEYAMYDPAKTHLKALLWTEFLHIDIITKKACTHPDDIQLMLNDLNINTSSQTISTRIIELSQNLKEVPR